MTKPTKRQHYVPQFYLRQWTDSNGCFYPIKINKKTPPDLDVFTQKSSPTKFCYENFFYAQHTGKEDKISQTLEKGFADMEGTFSNIIPKIEEKIINNKQISSNEKYHLSEFMIFLWIKGKGWREHSQKMSEHMAKEINKRLVHSIDKIPKMKAKLEEKGLTKEDIIKFAEEEKYSVDFGNTHHLALLKDMYGFCNMLSAKYWRIYISHRGEFITTDVPYSDIAINQNNFWGNDFLSREQSFILSPRVIIVALNPKNESGKKFVRKDITNDTFKIQQINMIKLMNSIKFGFHKNNLLLEGLKEQILLYYKNKTLVNFF